MIMPRRKSAKEVLLCCVLFFVYLCMDSAYFAKAEIEFAADQGKLFIASLGVHEERLRYASGTVEFTYTLDMKHHDWVEKASGSYTFLKADQEIALWWDYHLVVVVNEEIKRDERVVLYELITPESRRMYDVSTRKLTITSPQDSTALRAGVSPHSLLGLEIAESLGDADVSEGVLGREYVLNGVEYLEGLMRSGEAQSDEEYYVRISLNKGTLCPERIEYWVGGNLPGADRLASTLTVTYDDNLSPNSFAYSCYRPNGGTETKLDYSGSFVAFHSGEEILAESLRIELPPRVLIEDRTGEIGFFSDITDGLLW